MPDEQILARATIEKAPAPPPGGALTPDQQHVADLQKRMGKDNGLAGFTSALGATKPVDVRGEKNALDASFGIKRDETTGAKKLTEPDSRVNFDKANTSLTRARELLKGSLSGTERDAVVDSMVTTFESLPIYTDLFRAMPDDAARKAAAVELLTNPGVLEKIRAKYEGAIDTSQTLRDEVSAAQKIFDEAAAAEAKKSQEKIDKGQELRDARGIDTDFATVTTPGGTKTRRDELHDLQFDSAGGDRDLVAEEGNASRQVAQWRTRLESRTRNLANLEAIGKKAGDPEWNDANKAVTDADVEVGNVEKSFATARADRRRRDDLEREKSAIPGKIRNLEADELRLVGEYAEAERAKLFAQADLASKQISRASAEANYAEMTERIIPDALKEYLGESIQEANTAERKRLDELAGSAKTKTEGDLIRSIKERYLTMVKKGKISIAGKVIRAEKDELIIDSRAATADARDMMDPSKGGAEAKLQTALEAVTAEIPNPTPPPPKIPNPNKDAEIAAIMNDPVLKEKYIGEIAKGAFTQYIQSGGKISAAQEAYINAQPWGQDLIKTAMETPGVKAKEKELLEKGLLPPGGFKEFMKTKRGKIALAVLLAMAAGFVLPVAVPFVAAGGAGAVLGGNN